MKEIQREEFQPLELGVLRYIHQCCREHGLTYYLCFGTLLGAIRHKGFIPWDDDVDIAMPRADYFKLMEIIDKDNSPFAFLSIHNVKDYPFPLAKVVDARTKLVQNGSVGTHERLGIYVDVFILDNLPDDRKEREAYYKRVERAEKLWYMAQRKLRIRKGSVCKDLVLAACSLPFKLISIMKYAWRLDRLAAAYENCDCREQAVVLWTSGTKIVAMEKERWQQVIEVPFEGESFTVMADYESFLTQRYGDYMCPPPVEQQRPEHDFTAYWRD